jgi:Pyruvate/2-oxoacid:ferredoxin oxidoreductase delta subunit
MDPVYIELAKRIGLGDSERIPALFQIISEPHEAEMLLAMPGTALSLAEKLDRPVEHVNTALETLFVKGLVFPSMKTDTPTYRMGRDLVQFHDATILWPGARQSFLDLWQEFMEVEWPEVAKRYSEIVPRPFTRIIPVGVTIQAKSHVLAYEDVEEIINSSKSLSVTKCTCRLTAHKCDKQLEACLQINRAADYSLARGTGRKLTKEEALDLVRRCEEEGLIHVVMNKQSVDHFICNCCSCCCQTMPVLIQHNVRVIEPSRFAAKVDPDLCTACETCLERCFFGAISVAADQSAQVDEKKCMGCGLCQVTCPSAAISMTEVRERDFIPEKLFG